MKATLVTGLSCVALTLMLGAQRAAAVEAADLAPANATALPAAGKDAAEVQAKDQDKDKRSKKNDPKDDKHQDGNAGGGNDKKNK